MRKSTFLALILIRLVLPIWGEEIPSPEAFLGFQVGADRELADWQEIVSYFKALAQNSDRVMLVELGQTTQENPFVMVVISDPATLADLATFQEIQAFLADPRKLTAGPQDLIERGKTIVLTTCAVHSTEVASAQMSMELAYDLARGEDPETQEILQNVIFLLVPSLNPDGVNIVNHWYKQTLGTPAEGSPPPQLYHTYVGHDNNRDWYMFTQKETRLAVEKIHNVWHPQIIVDVHEMGPYGPRMFVPPFIDPIDPNVDPILRAEIVALGGNLFSALIGAGKEGIVTQAIYDAYTPARAYQHYHAGVRILLETASARLATPIVVRREELRSGRNYNAHRPSWNFPVPWPGGIWRLRDIVEYQKVALRAALLHGARHRRTWLRNFYQVGVQAIQRSAPYAFVVPPDQRDLQTLYDLLHVLELGEVEIHRAKEPFQVNSSQLVSAPLGSPDRREFPAGSYVILLQQPYGAFAKTLLEIQHYPESRQYPGGPLRRPFDVTAQTLGIQLGVETYQVQEPFQASLQEVGEVRIPEGQIQGEGVYWLFSHTSNSFARLANRLLKKGHSVSWAPNGFRAEEEGFPVGTLMVKFEEDATQFQELLEGLPVRVRRVKKWPELAWQQILLPRIGLYQSFYGAMDEGWTRWILERYEFPYHSLSDPDIREGDLSNFDVIVIPHQDPGQIEQGLGYPYPEQYRGGLGAEGVARLKQFAASGGTLLFLGAATQLPLLQWQLGASDLTGGVSPQEFYAPGSLLRVRVNNRHPIGYGMMEEAAVMFDSSPVFHLSRGLPVVQYSSEDLLLSGWITGEELLADKTALAEFRLEKGKLILIGFRTQFRAQTRGTYKFLFNSLYYATLRR
ncbi:MAG: M14 metallopeptidase family protein [Acidobacteriota bacterium]